jgi:hypothetical protein
LPVTMTGTMPAARKDVSVICRKMFEKFRGVTYLPSVKAEKNAQMASSATTMVYVCRLVRRSLARFETTFLKDPFESVFIETTSLTVM